MLMEDLKELVLRIQRIKSEDGQIELKAAKTGFPKIYDTLSSFSNKAGGGTIIFGIDESAGYEICGVYNAADLQKKISENCLQMEPPVRALCTVAELNEKIVVSAEIPEIELTQRPCYYKGAGRVQGSYLRVGDGDYKMSAYEVYSYEAFRQKIQDELRPLPYATRACIETSYLAEYLTKLAIAKPQLALHPVEKQLQLQNLICAGEPTLAGIVLFAEYPQSYLPRLCITAVVVPGTKMGDVSSEGARFIDNLTIEGTLPQMLHAALAFLRRNMATSVIIDPETGARKDKTEYPVTALREIILNALVHRDYSIHTDSAPITIVKYTDRIEIENPGGLYGRLTLDTLGEVGADTRNPVIARAMELLGETENRFSGIPTIRHEMELAGLEKPVFSSERGVFKVTLYQRTPPPPAREELPAFSAEILAFCQTPRTREALADAFSNVSKTYLMTQFVNPLVASGALTLSNPEKPRSKYQTFRTTLP